MIKIGGLRKWPSSVEICGIWPDGILLLYGFGMKERCSLQVFWHASSFVITRYG